MEITATIKNIRFRNDSNGWTVLSFVDSEGSTSVAVGVMPSINQGEHSVLVGNWTEHPMYGRQFKVESYRSTVPTTAAAVLAYLSSGFIKGIGESTAKQLVDEFGPETLDIIKNSPEKLTKIIGIGKKRAKQIHESYLEKVSMQDIIMGMQELGLSIQMAMRIYKLYGDDCVKTVKENPYRLIDDIENIGFKTADKIAYEAGYDHDSEFRVKAGIKYTLSLAHQEGNTCLPKDMLIMFTGNNVLGIGVERVEAILENMILSSELVEKTIDERPFIFLSYMHYIEMDCAVRLMNVCEEIDTLPFFDIDAEIQRLEKRYGIRLAELQSEAVRKSCTDGVLIVTGGPGTGKTTILRFIIAIMEHLGLTIELAAPTGRAAKRISDTTGREARTLHRLLEYNFTENEFNRNEDFPIEADVIIVDEMSMVDVPLFRSLLRAVDRGTRLIMVGDVDQLPSVGPGNVLRDIVNAQAVPVIRLNEIYRQAGRSMIVTNAHLINKGEMPILSRNESDFVFYECVTTDVALNSVLNLCRDFAYLEKSNEIQVLTPMKNNPLGVINLNVCLQEALNPPSPEKDEFRFGDTLFREGDRVMQIKNNYSIHWTKTKYGKASREDGEGIFNGDIGTVMQINNVTKCMTILFDDERTADYNFTQLEELELAYCISVHKSQGSEFPYVVLPLINGPAMLFNRNILYTAVTRARSKVFIIGSTQCVNYMVTNTRIKQRFSALACFLKERIGSV